MSTPAIPAVGTTVSFKAGPTQVLRTGKVTGNEGQFVLVEVDGKTLKTRPGAIIS